MEDTPLEVSEASANTGWVPRTPLNAGLSSSGAEVVSATPRRTAGTHFAAAGDRRNV